MKLSKRILLLTFALLLAVGPLFGCTAAGFASVQGRDGKDGMSAYDIAVKNGYEGSEKEWLESLKGVDGTAGKDGLSAYQLAVASGYEGTLEEWLLSLNGKDGKDGKDGEDGEDGENGKDGLGIFKIEIIGGYLIVTYTNGTSVNVGKLPESSDPDSSDDLLGSDFDDLPDSIDMNGETIYLRSHVRRENVNSFEAEKDGAVINNAVYDTNTAVEQRLSCNIVVNEDVVSGFGDEMYEEMYELAGVESYHILSCATYKMAQLAIDGLLVDLASQSYIDLNNHYYDQSYNEALRAGDRQYQVTGQMTLSWYRYQAVTMFNRNVFSEMNVAYPYQTVLEGNGKTGGWTLEAMMTTANQLYKDLNDDRSYDIDDQYGYFLQVGETSSHSEGYMSALGLRLVEKNSDGYYQSADVDVNSFAERIDDYLDLVYCKGSYASSSIYSEQVRRKFANNEAGMINLRLYHTEFNEMISLSKSGEGYGILPLPKANDGQLNYQSYIADQLLSFAIPNSMTGENRTNSAIFLEAYACEAYHTIAPVYEEYVFKICIDDELSKVMLEIIRSNIVVDPVNVYGDTVFGIHTQAMIDVYSEDVAIEDLLEEQITSGALDETVSLLNFVYRLLDAVLIETGE